MNYIVSKHSSKVYKYQPNNRDELKDLINKLIKERGNKADLNDIDTSDITDMCGLFVDSNFNGDISKWDVSNVTNISYMFDSSKFTGKNGDLSKLDVSNVKDMSSMFKGCPLQNNPPTWYKK